MTTLDKTKVLAEFTAAYKAAFNKAPKIEEKPGWYSVDGSKNMRLAELEELGQSYSTDTKSAVKDSAKPVKKTTSKVAKKSDKAAKKPSSKAAKTSETTAKKPTKKAAKKPATAKAKKAKADKPKTTASGSGETPEHVWQQHIEGNKQRMPRGYRE
ncbi:hypothetical protein [Rheinheimera salexigens]|uniref:Uncharacterized protein n=1 Tax=Rheinheimera salexigens TaxID=1628148 RepID=A0A1E7Q5N6_9GAMM|nr:hypothetical protein [Rheinheimera salexigens]OEY69492.1 hypothetical protein BI198_07900 [Rheinheimera salexigens]